MEKVISDDRDGTLIRVVLDSEQYHINKGKAFKAHIGAAALGNGGTMIIAFKTPLGPEKVHLTVIADSTGTSKLELLEGPTVTVDSGTMEEWKNRKRSSSIESGTFTIEGTPWKGHYNEDPTVTVSGEILETYHMGVGVNKQWEMKWELNEDTVYAARLTSGEAANIANLILLQYETEDY